MAGATAVPAELLSGQMVSPIGPRPPLAVVTLLGDEPELLPIWLRHYTAQVGAAHCYVFISGGGNAAAEAAGVALIRLPAGLPDRAHRAEFIARFCTALLEWYDAVLHAEPDEIIVADLEQHRDLADYAAHGRDAEVLGLGLAVLHHPSEPPIDPGRKILAQRKYVQFRAALCRPVLWRAPRAWPPGAAPAPAFGGLFLFHLRLADRQIGLARLGRARLAEPPAPGWWNSVSDDMFLRSLHLLATRRVDPNVELTIASRVAWHTIAGMPAPGDEPEERYAEYEIDTLWPVPERFR